MQHISNISFSLFCILLQILVLPYKSICQNSIIDRIDADITYLPDSNHALPDESRTFPLSFQSIESNGMGRISLFANQDKLNFINNPSSLAKKGNSVEIFNLNLIVPGNTVNTTQFISENYDQIQSGEFLKKYEITFDSLANISGFNFQEFFSALALLEEAKASIDQLIVELIDSLENPASNHLVHIPSFMFQFKNFGVAYYNNFRMYYSVIPGILLEELSKYEFTASEIFNLDPEELVNILGLIYFNLEENGNIIEEAIPRLYSIAISDHVVNLSYGLSIHDNFDMGAGINIINRRTSASVLKEDDYTRIFAATVLDNKQSDWHYSFNLSGIYHSNWGTDFSFSAMNLIPWKMEASKLSYTTTENNITSNDFNILNLDDTIHITSEEKTINNTQKYFIKTPFILNMGLKHDISPHIMMVFEVKDILENNDYLYDRYAERLSIGMETSFFDNKLSFRSGISMLKPTFGISYKPSFRNISLRTGFATSYFKESELYAYMFSLGVAIGKK